MSWYDSDQWKLDHLEVSDSRGLLVPPSPLQYGVAHLSSFCVYDRAWLGMSQDAQK